eukprot:CAMPEP_0115859282 /NCGR_PEP_ID=MMETSP0287-20121206/16535_1 /TAXON_ID=412157 /ORGANISM="Chrysochromulina rotalis, Strain UIO044" /LENGTH=190 /DNA_ID=CAMNT_0003313577 /DNA_START=255 /DNA_END=824 /DNA_ORIENTATION=+
MPVVAHAQPWPIDGFALASKLPVRARFEGTVASSGLCARGPRSFSSMGVSTVAGASEVVASLALACGIAPTGLSWRCGTRMVGAKGCAPLAEQGRASARGIALLIHGHVSIGSMGDTGGVTPAFEDGSAMQSRLAWSAGRWSSGRWMRWNVPSSHARHSSTPSSSDSYSDGSAARLLLVVGMAMRSTGDA